MKASDILGTLVEVESLQLLPDTFECGEVALEALLKQVPKERRDNLLGIAALAGMAIVQNPELPKNEVHLVSYRNEGGQTVRTLHKIFNLEVS